MPDADDLYVPTVLAAMRAHLTAHANCDLVMGRVQIMRSKDGSMRRRKIARKRGIEIDEVYYVPLEELG